MSYLFLSVIYGIVSIFTFTKFKVEVFLYISAIFIGVIYMVEHFNSLVN